MSSAVSDTNLPAPETLPPLPPPPPPPVMPLDGALVTFQDLDDSLPQPAPIAPILSSQEYDL